MNLEDVPVDGVVVLTCRNCGAPLRITSGMEKFSCAHCGTVQLVKRSGGQVTLTPLVAAVTRVEGAANRAAAELAIQRLTAEIVAMKAEVARLENADVDKVAPPPPSVHMAQVGLFFLSGLLVIGTLLTMPGATPFILLGCGVGCYLLFNYLRRKRVGPVATELDRQWEAAKAKLSTLEHQLAANQRIVAGQ